MTEFVRVWLMAAAAAALASVAVAAVARRWRRCDAAFWHAVQTAVMAAAVAAPFAAIVLPTVAVMSPATERFALSLQLTPSMGLLTTAAAIYAAGAVAM